MTSATFGSSEGCPIETRSIPEQKLPPAPLTTTTVPAGPELREIELITGAGTTASLVAELAVPPGLVTTTDLLVAAPEGMTATISTSPRTRC